MLAAFLKLLLDKLIPMVVGKLGGPLGWLATQLLKYGGNYIINWVTWFVDKITKKAERDKKNEEAVKKYG